MKDMSQDIRQANFEELVVEQGDQHKKEKKRGQRTARKAAKKEKDAISNNEKMIKLKSRLVLVIAVLIFIVSFLLKPLGGLVNSAFGKVALESAANVLESLSGIVLGISIGSMLLDFFSYVKYAQERVKEVIVDKSFLETVNEEEKRRIISTLESSLYFKNQPIPQDSLYINIKEKVLPLLEGEYSPKYYAHVSCEIKDGKIYKTIYNELVIYSPTENSCYKLPFAVYFSSCDIEGIEKPYSIESVKLNKEDIDIAEDAVDKKPIGAKEEQQRFVFEEELRLEKGINKISYMVKSVVDLADNIYSRTVTLPCKNYIIDFSLKNKDYSVTGYGFAIDKEETVSIYHYGDGCRIEFTDWIIPGDGCIFIINKKVNADDADGTAAEE